MPQFSAKMRAISARVGEVMLTAAEQGRAYGEGRIKRRLSGAVLRRQGGALRDSIASEVQSAPSRVVIRFRVGDGLKYARIHEFGGVIQGRPWLVFPLRLQGRRGKATWRKVRQVNMPKRPYLLPSVEETAPFVQKALASGLKALLKGSA